MDNGKQKAKSEESGIGGLLLFGGLVGAGIWGVLAWDKKREADEAARRRFEAQQLEEAARRAAAFEAELQAQYQRKIDEAVERVRAESAERERQARESAAREARAAEERREQEYRKREEKRDRRFETHEEARSRIASDHVAQKSRDFARWLTERDAEVEPLREHASFLRDLSQPTRPHSPTTVPTADDPEMDAVYAELGRVGKVDLDG